MVNTGNNNFEIKKLGDIVNITMGQSPESKYYNKKNIGLPLIQGNADIKNRETIVRTFTSKYPKRGKMGDTIMSVRAPVGEIAKATFDCCLGRGVCAISYVNNYVYYYMIFIENKWGSLSTGSTFDSINSKEVNNLKILLPKSKEEQNTIAQILSNADELIKQLDYLITKKKNIKEGSMQELLTGKRRLEGFNEEWKSISLGKLFTVFTGKAKSKYVVEFGKYLIMDMGSVSSEGMNICEKQTNFEGDFLQIGDLVMPKDDIGGGKIIGKTVIVDKNKKYVLGDHVYVLRIKNDKNNSKFLSYMINSFWINSDIHKKVTGSAQLGINRKTVEEQTVIIPTDIEEQIRITNIISDMDSEIEQLEIKKDKYLMIKNGMMQKLLTGEIRLT
jgi:type I restriction enzyme, S subunit